MCLFDLKIGNCFLTASLFYDFMSAFCLKLNSPQKINYCSKRVKVVDLSNTAAQQTTILCPAFLRASVHRLSTRKRHRQHIPECTLHLPSGGLSWQPDLHLVLGGGQCLLQEVKLWSGSFLCTVSLHMSVPTVHQPLSRVLCCDVVTWWMIMKTD